MRKWISSTEEGLTLAPILSHPKEDAPRFIQTDASDTAIGGVIGMIVENKTRIIAYFNKTLNASQLNWSTPEKEMYAIVTAVEPYKHILVDNPFKKDRANIRQSGGQ